MYICQNLLGLQVISGTQTGRESEGEQTVGTSLEASLRDPSACTKAHLQIRIQS